MEKKESNRLIAEFMGWQHHENAEYDEHEMANLKYDTSFDWLIPVVEKIENTKNKNGYKHQVIIHNNICWIEQANVISYPKNYIYGKDKIEAVYNAVVKFIQSL